MQDKMNIGCVQIKIEEDVQRNIEKVNELTSDYSNYIFLLPELFTTGFNYEHIEKQTENHFEVLQDLSEKNIYMGSILRFKDGKRYNSFFVKYNKEVYFVYDKVNLFPLMDEDKYFSSGDGYYTFDINGVTAGCAICFDLRYCEVFYHLRSGGAKIVFLPAEWPAKRVEHFRALSIARAIENQLYFVCCNAMGNTWSDVFGGNSMIIDPWGKVVADAKNFVDNVIVAEIDINLVDEVRNKLPMRRKNE